MSRRFVETLTRSATTLDTVEREVDELEKDLSDTICPQMSSSHVKFDPYSESFIFSFIDKDNLREDLYLTVFSLSQLCSKVGVPVIYVYKCLDTHEDWAISLITNNINEWLERNTSENLLIRKYKNTVRGILTEKYTTFDSPDIIKGLKLGLSRVSEDFRVTDYLVSPERLHIRLIRKTPIKSLDEDLYTGLIINSSDVGRSSISFEYFVYKQVCTNGLIAKVRVGQGFRKVHLGSIEEIADGFSDAVSYIDEYEEVMAKLISNAKTKDYSETLRNPESEAYEKLTNMIKTQTGLSSNAVMDVLAVMTTKYGTDNWALVNAITEEAQKYTLDRRVLLEKAAGHILTIS